MACVDCGGRTTRAGRCRDCAIEKRAEEDARRRIRQREDGAWVVHQTGLGDRSAEGQATLGGDIVTNGGDSDE